MLAAYKEKFTKPALTEWAFLLVSAVLLYFYHVPQKHFLAVVGFFILALFAKLFFHKFLVPAGFLCLVYVAYYWLRFIPFLGGFPYNFFIVSFFAFGLCRWLKFPMNWRWSFNFSKVEWISVAIIIIPTIFILSSYFYLHPELKKDFVIPAISPYLLILYLLFFAVVNGLREELLFRVLMHTGFEKNLSVIGTILLQSLCFGFIHFQAGFPRGWVGLGLTMIFGIVTGIQAVLFRSASLLWFTHSLADFLMFLIIVYLI